MTNKITNLLTRKLFSTLPDKADEMIKSKNSNTKTATDSDLELFRKVIMPGSPGLTTTGQEKFDIIQSLYYWEVIPKYIFTHWLVKSLRSKDNPLKEFVLDFPMKVPSNKNGDQVTLNCKVRITPAIIDGELCYPGETEELVEEAMKVLIMHGHGEYVAANEPGNVLRFSYGDIHNVLAKFKRGRNRKEIARAIEVMDKTHLKIEVGDDMSFSTNLLMSVKTVNRAKYERNKKTGKGVVSDSNDDSTRLHEVRVPDLVSHQIATKQYRQIDAELLTSLKNGLSRDLYRKLVNRYVQAGKGGSDYNLRLSHMIDTGRILKEEPTRRARAKAKVAMDELVSKGQIKANWSTVDIKGQDGSRKTIDIQYVFETTDRFVAQIKKSNLHKKKLGFEHQLELKLEEKRKERTTANRIKLSTK